MSIRSLRRLVTETVDSFLPQLQTLLELHGPKISEVTHRVIRATVEIGLTHGVMRLVRRHPVLAIVIAAIGTEAIDAVIAREASRIADLVTRHLALIGLGVGDEDFLDRNGIAPLHLSA
jgi:hypothetical protein